MFPDTVQVLVKAMRMPEVHAQIYDIVLHVCVQCTCTFGIVHVACDVNMLKATQTTLRSQFAEMIFRSTAVRF